MTQKLTAEYVWIDGHEPTPMIRSKVKVFTTEIAPEEFAAMTDGLDWSFDGSSTEQAEGDNSDVVLKPVTGIVDPLRSNGVIFMCETFNVDGTPHSTNARAQMREILEAGAERLEAWFGFEQEYTLFNKQKTAPLGWPEGGSPEDPQGPYYCGVGPKQIVGREVIETHLQMCIDAGINIYGANAEVMMSQWEFQVGPVEVVTTSGKSLDAPDALTTCDHIWLARWLLYRVGEEFEVEPSFDPKPKSGDWNGAGMHTNFSTANMRSKENGQHTISRVVEALAANHQEHIEDYGDGIEKRLTGEHETCNVNTFKSGDSDRGCSIRIPPATTEKGYGYIEDRRPNANGDPYKIAKRILQSIKDVG